jgi:hypothetical protein
MPSTTERQRRFMGAELGREEKGEETETGMSREKLRDFARKEHRGGKRNKRAHHRGHTRKSGRS